MVTGNSSAPPVSFSQYPEPYRFRSAEDAAPSGSSDKGRSQQGLTRIPLPDASHWFKDILTGREHRRAGSIVRVGGVLAIRDPTVRRRSMPVV